MPAKVIGTYPLIWSKGEEPRYDPDTRISTAGMGMIAGDYLIGILTADALHPYTQMRASPGSSQPFAPVIQDVRFGAGGIMAALMIGAYTGWEDYFNFELTSGPAGLSVIHVRGIRFVSNVSGFQWTSGPDNTLGPFSNFPWSGPAGIGAGAVITVAGARGGDNAFGPPTGGYGYDTVISSSHIVTSGQVAFKALTGQMTVPAMTVHYGATPYLWHCSVVVPGAPVPAGFAWIVD